MRNILIICFCFLSCSVVLSQNFTLTQVPGILVWYKADVGVHTNNDSVFKIEDFSGNNNHALQSILSKQPKLIPNILNNNPVIRFDGTDDFLSFNTIGNIQDCFFVLKHRTGAQDYATILGSNSSYDFIGGTDSLLFSNQYVSPAINSGTVIVNNLSKTTTNAFKPKEYSLINIRTQATLSCENIGNDRNSSGRFWDGDFVEIILFSQTISTANRDSLIYYLNKKYTQPIELGTDIIAINLCDTLISPNNANLYSNYSWSNNDTTSSITVNANNTYSVTAKNIFGITTTDFIKVTYPGNYLRGDIVFCANDTITWNTQLPKNQFTFEWQDNSTDSVFKITQAGDYHLKITDSNGCFIYSDTVHAIIDNFPNTQLLGPDVSICSGNFISIITPPNSIQSYTWNTSATTNSIVITNSGLYSVIATNTNNCIAKDTVNVTVLGVAPVANYTYTQVCKNSPVFFTDNSVADVGSTIISVSWNFGDILSSTNTSTVSNPFHMYADSGNYLVTLNIVANTGCPQSITKIVHVVPTPIVNFSFALPCQKDSTAFTENIFDLGYSVNNYNWSFGDIISGSANTSTLSNPKHTFSQNTTYTVKLIATNTSGCVDSITKNVLVKSQVAANFTTTALCKNIPVTFQDNSITPSPNYQHIRIWNLGTGNLSGLSVIKTFTNTGVYTASLTVNGYNGCNSTIVKQFTINAAPVSNFTLPNTCLNMPVVPMDMSSSSITNPITNWVWSLNNGNLITMQSPTLSILSAGTYSLKLLVITAAGCKDSITKGTTVYPLPIVDFTTTPTTYLYTNQTISFLPTITNGSNYNWLVNGVNTTTNNFMYTPTMAGEYTVTLTHNDINNCNGSKTKRITVNDSQLDLGIVSVTPLLNANGYIELNADIANYGTIPISDFDINGAITNAGILEETYSGLLTPGALITYHFKSKLQTNEFDSNPILCISIKNINSLSSDDNISNNSLCKALYNNDVKVYDAYPNPITAQVTIPINSNKDQEITYEIISTTGQTITGALSYMIYEGINFLQINTSQLSRGTYIVKIIFDDKIYIKKVIK